MFGPLIARMFLWVSLAVVATLAMRPKLSLALLATLPTTVAIVASRSPNAVPDLVWVAAVIVSGWCLAAVILAVLFRRAGDQSGYFGGLPLGHEVYYSASDRAGLFVTLVVIGVAIAGCLGVAWQPPFHWPAARVLAAASALLLLVPLRSVMLLIGERDVNIRITDDHLTVTRRGVTEQLPWDALAGFSFAFGIFRVFSKSGETVLRVDSSIDNFLALLYHVNRHTFRVPN